MEGRGSSWTALHRPIGIEEVRIMESENDENTVVKEMMLKHGWENVRGGSYSKVGSQSGWGSGCDWARPLLPCHDEQGFPRS
jgi:hypothetical protein